MESVNHSFSFIQEIEKNIKAILSAGVIVYAWGFLIVSAYLSKYHILPLSILRIQYILAGIWIFIPILIFIVLCFWFAASLNDSFLRYKKAQAGKRRWRFLGTSLRLVYDITVPLGWIIIAVVSIKFVSPSTITEFDAIKSSGILKTGIYCLVIALLISFSWVFLKDVRTISGKISMTNLLRGITLVSMTGVAIFSYTLYFATNIYPKIPAVMGGGQPIDVKLIFVSDDNYATVQKTLNYAESQESPPTLNLITTTDEYYIVLDPNDAERAIAIPKKNIYLSILENK